MVGDDRASATRPFDRAPWWMLEEETQEASVRRRPCGCYRDVKEGVIVAIDQ